MIKGRSWLVAAFVGADDNQTDGTGLRSRGGCGGWGGGVEILFEQLCRQRETYSQESRWCFLF